MKNYKLTLNKHKEGSVNVENKKKWTLNKHKKESINVENKKKLTLNRHKKESMNVENKTKLTLNRHKKRLNNVENKKRLINVKNKKRSANVENRKESINVAPHDDVDDFDRLASGEIAQGMFEVIFYLKNHHNYYRIFDCQIFQIISNLLRNWKKTAS